MKIEPITVEKPKAVLFDWAGVMVYDGLKIFGRANPQYEEWGLPTGTISSAKDIFWIPLSLGQITEQQFWDSIAERIGAHGQVPYCNDTLSVPDYLQKVREDLLESHKPYPYSFQLVDMYKRHEIPVGLLTNNCKEWLEVWEKEYRLSERFDPIVASCHVGRRKPEPGVYFEALRRLEKCGVDEPKEVLIYDDQERNVEAATALGFRGVLFKPLYSPPITFR